MFCNNYCATLTSHAEQLDYYNAHGSVITSSYTAMHNYFSWAILTLIAFLTIKEITVLAHGVSTLVLIAGLDGWTGLDLTRLDWNGPKVSGTSLQLLGSGCLLKLCNHIPMPVILCCNLPYICSQALRVRTAEPGPASSLGPVFL